VSGCYQDDDPKYQTSAFNNFNRVDGFDSDLWNNDERFTEAEYGPLLKQTEKESLNIVQALSDGRNPVSNDIKVETRDKAPQPPRRTFVTLEEHKFDAQNAYERLWLEELLGKETPFRVTILQEGVEMPDKPIVIVQKPHIELYTKLFEQWEAEKFPYYVLHLSDEFGTDPISFYSFSQCLGVVRTYPRADLPLHKTVVIPLGYHWTSSEGSQDPLNKTPRLPFRNTVWSFYGTGWQNRKRDLDPLASLQPNSLLLVDSWESPQKLTHTQYIARLLDTVFVPCPRGNNVETFRLYEALECGCVPIYVKSAGDDLYLKMLQDELGLLPVSSWNEAKQLMEHLYKEKMLLETYRNTLLTQWKVWKAKLSDKVRHLWDL
jgi:hypothetical protein